MPFVNTASSAGGDGTTNATSGANRAYVSHSEFNTQEAADLVTAAAGVTCEYDGSGGADTAGNVQMTGWVTDASFFITMNGNRTGHIYNTTDDAGGYRLEFTTSGNYAEGIQFGEGFTEVNDFQMQITSANLAAKGYEFSGTECNIRRSIIKGVLSGSPGSNARGIFQSNAVSGDIFACLAFDWIATDNVAIAFYSNSTTTPSFGFNLTAHNCSVGFGRGYDDFTIRNCLAQNCTDGYIANGWLNATNNCSDITSDAPGTSPQTGNVVFTDEAGDDFELSASDTVAKGNGVDLSGTFDFDGDNNAMPAAWPIGFMQEASAAGGRIMSSLAYSGGLAHKGGIAGKGGGLAN